MHCKTSVLPISWACIWEKQVQPDIVHVHEECPSKPLIHLTHIHVVQRSWTQTTLECIIICFLILCVVKDGYFFQGQALKIIHINLFCKFWSIVFLFEFEEYMHVSNERNRGRVSVSKNFGGGGKFYGFHFRLNRNLGQEVVIL